MSQNIITIMISLTLIISKIKNNIVSIEKIPIITRFIIHNKVLILIHQ